MCVTGISFLFFCPSTFIICCNAHTHTGFINTNKRRTNVCLAKSPSNYTYCICACRSVGGICHRFFRHFLVFFPQCASLAIMLWFTDILSTEQNRNDTTMYRVLWYVYIMLVYEHYSFKHRKTHNVWMHILFCYHITQWRHLCNAPNVL